MAGSGRKVWVADEVLAAADLQNYIQDQTVMVYASAAARTSGILSPTEGMITYLTDVNRLYFFDGANWIDVIADGSITNAKLATDSVTADKVAADSIGASEIVPNSITDAECASGVSANASIKRGYVSGVTSGGGDHTVSHGLGSTPSVVIVTGGLTGFKPGQRTYAVHGFTGTTFNVRTYDVTTGAGIPAGLVDFFWTAYL